MSILWALWQNDIDASGDTPGSGTDTAVTKRVPVVILVKNWWSGVDYVNFSAMSTAFSTIHTNNQIPLLNWTTTASSGTPSPLLTNALIAGGSHDTFIQNFATSIKNLGYPVMILLDEEVNLSSNPWYDAAGTSYINMYKHVVDVFDAQGATNVSWVWSVNEVAPAGIISTWWPGNRANGRPYVDWATFDSFNNSYVKGLTWETFDQIMEGDGSYNGDTWTKLIALDSTGITRYGLLSFSSDNRTQAGANDFAHRASWITDAYSTQIPNFGSPTHDYSKLELVGWFNQNEPNAGLSDGFEHWSATANDANSLAAFIGPLGPGSSAYYIAGDKFLAPAGMNKVGPYSGMVQSSAFTTAVLSTAPTHLKAYWKLNDPSGTTATDSGGSSLNGTYTAGFTLAQPKIIPGTLDQCTLFNGSTGYVTVADNAAFTIPTTGTLTAMAVFKVVALPGAFGVFVGKGGDGTGFEWAMRVSSAGALEGISWNLAGATYVDATSANVVSNGQTWLMFVTFDTSRSPIGRIGYAQLGATSLTFTNSVADTLANASTDGTGTLSIGRRSDNTQFVNANISHVAIWNTPLSDLSQTAILLAASVRRDKPRVSGVS